MTARLLWRRPGHSRSYAGDRRVPDLPGRERRERRQHFRSRCRDPKDSGSRCHSTGSAMHESEVLSSVSPRRARAALHPADGVCLLQADAGLRRAIPAAEQRLAQRVLTAPRCTLTPGMDVADQLATGGQEPFGALLVDGFVVRESTVAGDVSAEVLGPGDIVRPWRVTEAAVPCTTRWAVPAGAVAAVLDARLPMAARRWPQLPHVVRERLAGPPHSPRPPPAPPR